MMQPLRYVHSHIEISTQLLDETKRADDAYKELERDPEKLAASMTENIVNVNSPRAKQVSWRCRLGLHRWRGIPRVWWSLGPPGYECEVCGKRYWLDP